MMTDVFLFLVILFSLVTIWKVYKDSKLKLNSREFFLHGENLDRSSLVATLVSTNLSLGNMVFICGMLGYFYGWSGVFWSVATIIFLGIGFVVFGKGFKEYVEEKGNYGTIHDFISKHHDTTSQNPLFTSKIAAATTSILSLFIAIIIEIHIGSMIISQIIGVNQAILVLCIMFLVAFYTITSGFRTVVFTDRLQFFCMAVSIIAGAYLFSSLPSSLSFIEAGYEFSVSDMFIGVGYPTAIGLIILGFFWLISTPDTWQRNCATRNIDTSISGSIIGTILMCIFVFAFAIGGMLVKTNIEPLVSSSNQQFLSKGFFTFADIFLIDYHSLGSVTNIVLALIAVGILMAAISTIDTFLVVIGHTLNVDLGLSLRKVKSFDEVEKQFLDKPLLVRGRAFILFSSIAVFIGWLIMLNLDLLVDPLSLFFVTYTIQFCLAIPVLATRNKKTCNSKTTSFVILFSAIITTTIGLYGMLNLSSSEIFILFAPATWLAILPIIPIVIGIISYSVLYLTKSRRG